MERVGILVEAMRRHRLRGAPQPRANRLDDHFMRPHVADNHSVGRLFAHRGSAFDDLARMPGQSVWQAHQDRHCRVQRRITAAACHDEVDPGLERRLQGLDAHHAHHAHAAIDDRRIQVWIKQRSEWKLASLQITAIR